jgi:hypothetical protein
MIQAEGPSSQIYPDIPLGDQVKGFLRFYAMVNGYDTPEGLSRVAGQTDEVESLRGVISACTGETLTEVDIILGLNNVVTDIK